MTHLIAPLSPADPDELRRLARRAGEDGADLIELRLDLAAAAGADPEALVAAIPALALPVLATNRRAGEGGAWPDGDPTRLDLLRAAAGAGARWIDVELASLPALPERPAGVGLVLSHHDFAGMGGDLAGRVARMRAAGADVAKVAVTPADARDLAVLHGLHRPGDGPLIALGMGEAGLPSRLLAGAWGGFAGFGCLDRETATAPGQLPLDELRSRFRVNHQGPDTRVFGVCGPQPRRDRVVAIHNWVFAALRLDAVCVPLVTADPPGCWRAGRDWLHGLAACDPDAGPLVGADAADAGPTRDADTLRRRDGAEEGVALGAAATDADLARRELERCRFWTGTAPPIEMVRAAVRMPGQAYG